MIPNLRAPAPQDQLNYLQAAAAFPRTAIDPDAPPGADVTHQLVRYGLILPTRLAIEVFGYSQAAYYTVPVLATLLLLASCHLLGCLLFSPAVGAGGALLVVAATPIFRDQSDLMPDLFGTALFTAAVTLAVAVRLGHLGRGWPTLMTLGALLGWSYLVREYLVFGWPLVPSLLWRRGPWRRNLRDLALVAVPVIGLWLGETALCGALFHDPLLRLKVALGHGAAPSAPGFAKTYRDKPRLDYILRLPQALGRPAEGPFLLGLLVVALLGGGCQLAARLWRALHPASRLGRGATGQAAVLLLGWCALVWVPLTLLGGVIDPSAPKLRLQLVRYWFPVFPAVILGGLGVVWLSVRWAGDRWCADRGFGWVRRLLPGAVAVMVATAPAVIALRHSWGLPATRIGGGTQLDAFRTWMSAHERSTAVVTVWADNRTDGVLRVFRTGPFGGRAWRAEIRTWLPDGPQPAVGDLIVVFDGGPCLLCQQAVDRILATRAPRLGAPVFADAGLWVYPVIGSSPR